MSMSDRFFKVSVVSQHEDTIESLHAELTNARRATNPNQDKIASIKARIRELELRAMNNGITNVRDFRTNH